MNKGQQVADIRVPNGGMNQDVHQQYIPQEDYYSATNYRNNTTHENNVGGGGNGKGNKTDMFYFPANYVERIVGSVYDAERDRTICFGYNDTTNFGSIFYYDDTYDGADWWKYIILYKTKLIFETDEKVLNPKITKDYLVWTDTTGVHFLDVIRANNYYVYSEGGDVLGHSLYTYSFWESAITPIQNLHYVVFNSKIYKYTASVFQGNPTDYPADYSEITDYDKAYTSLAKNVWDLAPTPPKSAPTPSYSYDDSYLGNNVIKSQFRFAYKYEYIDGRQSVWSPQSIVPTPTIAEDSQGFYDSVATNNIIDIVLNTGDNNVSKIFIAAIELGVVNPKIIDVIDVVLDSGDTNIVNGIVLTPQTEFTYKSFYNNQYYKTVNISDFNKSYWSVPDLAESIELLDDGRLMCFNITEGFDIDKVNENDFSVGSEDVDPLAVDSTDILTLPNNPVSIPTSFGSVDYYQFPDYEVDGVVYADVGFRAGGSGAFIKREVRVSYKHNYNLTNDENLEALIKLTADVLQNEMNNTIPSLPDFFTWAGSMSNPASIAPLDADKSIAIIPSYIDVGAVIEVVVSSLDYELDSPKIKTLKYNSKYDIGIVYYDDKLKSSGVTNIQPLQVPNYGDSTGWDVDGSTIPATSVNAYQQRYIQVALNSIPPLNAEYWGVAITQNKSTTSSITLPILGSKAFRSDADFTTNTTTGLYIAFNLSDTVETFIENNQNCQIQDWVFEAGDRLRFVGKKNGIKNYTYEDYWDAEIVGQKSSNNDMLIIYNATRLTDLSAKGNLFELYRPKKTVGEDDDIYFEVGGLQSILASGTSSRSHACSDTNQVVTNGVSTTAGVHVLKYGDTYIRRRALVSVGYFIVEDESWSDYFPSDLSDRGRPQLFLPEMKREQRDTVMRFGGVLLPTSNINNIAEFESGNSDVLSGEYGSINGARLKGYTLQVFQDTKVTSYYINKDVLTRADGSTTLIAKPNVLNNKNVSEFDYGCVNPESIIKRDNNILFFDAINGCFVRSASNGMYPISKYGISAFAKELGKQVLDDGKYVVGGYDEYNDEFIWVSDYNYGNGNAITFKDKENKWISFWEFWNTNQNIVSLLGKYRNKLLSFIDNDIYLHDDNTLYNTMHGRSIDCSVAIPFNKEPLQNKVLNYIVVESNDSWENNDVDAVSIEEGEMESMVTGFRNKEGVYYANFKRDALTPMSGTTLEKIAKGRRLRGRYGVVEIKNSTTSNKVKLGSVVINSTISERL